MVSTRSNPMMLSRRSALRLAAAGLAAVPLAVAGNATVHAQATPVAGGDIAAWLAQMNEYADAGTFPAVQENAAGVTSTVLVEIPAIEFTGEGQSSTLPTGPLQYIYRFQDSEIAAPADGTQPFKYVEIDWNTEGAPRGPSGAFSSPHFDFHFYSFPTTK